MTESTPNDLLAEAVSCHQANQLEQAQVLYKQLLEQDPHNINALHLLGVCFFQQGNAQASIEFIEQAIAINPDIPEFHVNLANALQTLNHCDKAIAHLAQAISLNTQSAEAHFTLGNILSEQKKYDESITEHEKVIAINPIHWGAHNNLGNVYQKLDQHEKAIRLYENILSHNPNDLGTYYNLANSFKSTNQLDRAIVAFQKVVTLDHSHADAYFDLGKLYAEVDDTEKSINHYDKSTQLNPNYKKLAFNHSAIYLTQGKLKLGFYLYENRWSQYDSNQHTPHPLWLGEESIDGKNLLILYEQGLGDTIQMIRYVSLLQKNHVNCWIQIPTTLLSLMERSFKNIKWIMLAPAFSKDTFLVPLKPIKGIDYCTYTMSLPLAMKTFEESDIPNHTPYLIADVGKSQKWRKKLGNSNKLKVGLVWRGNPTNQTDYYRSMSLSILEPLFDIKNIEFITIQKDLTNDEKNILSKHENVSSYDNELVNFDESAALIMNLDVVISICSSPAHLAAALGKNTWVMLPLRSDWRWLLDRHDSPWYPSARLFRQSKDGDWSDVLQKVKEALIALTKK